MMDGLTIAILVTLLLGVAGLLLLGFQIWAVRAQPTRILADTFKTRPLALPGPALRQRMRGQFVELGFDLDAHQSVVLAEDERFTHVLNLGRSGVGKTSYFLAAFLWRDIANGVSNPEVPTIPATPTGQSVHSSAPGNSIVVFDGQRDLTEPVIALCEQYQRDYVVFPEAGFNPLAGSGDADSRAERFADLFAQAMEIQTGTPADFYTQRAQIFVRKVIPLFERVYARPMTLQELLYLTIGEDYRQRLVDAAGFCPERTTYVALIGAQWTRADFEHNLSGLQNLLDRLQIGSRAWLYNQRDALSLERAIDEGKVIIVREGGDLHSQGRTLGLMYMLALQAYVRNRAADPALHPVWVYADEAHLYFNANFPTLIATARKKRVALHLGFQNFAQFHPFTETVTGNAATWIVHGGLLYEDATFVADQIGRRTFHDHTINHDPGHPLEHPRQTASVVYDYLIQPDRIRGLPGDRAIVLSVSGRETQAARLIHKPDPVTLTLRAYEPSPVPPYAPPTIWDEALGGEPGRETGSGGRRGDGSPKPAPESTEAADAMVLTERGTGAEKADGIGDGIGDGTGKIVHLYQRRGGRAAGRRRDDGDDTPPFPPEAPE